MKQLSGIHDLERILATVHHFRVPALVCIDKADLNPAHSGAFQAYGLQQGIEVVGCLPYDTVVTEAMVQGLPVTVYRAGGAHGCCPARDVGACWSQAWERRLMDKGIKITSLVDNSVQARSTLSGRAWPLVPYRIPRQPSAIGHRCQRRGAGAQPPGDQPAARHHHRSSAQPRPL